MYTTEQEIEDFIHEYGRSKIIIATSVRGILKRAQMFEYKFNKPFHRFNIEEIMEMYEEAHAISVTSLQNTNLLLKNASRWMKYQHGDITDSAYENITKDMLGTVVDINKKNRLILTKDDLDEISSQLLNWTDRAILLMLFKGAGGYMLKELTFMQLDQVSRTDLKVYFKNGKTIDITEQEYDILKNGFSEDELMSFGTTSRVSKVRSLGLYKARFNVLSNNDNPEDKADLERRYRWTQRRLMLISDDLGIKLTAGGVQTSGLLWNLQRGIKETGLVFREFVKSEQARELAKRYDIFSEYYGQILLEKFEQYFQ
jgi:hypothetical protein